jgi:hypothetical protein
MRLEKESCRRRYIYIYSRHVLYSPISSMVLTVLMRGVLSVVVIYYRVTSQARPDQTRLKDVLIKWLH